MKLFLPAYKFWTKISKPAIVRCGFVIWCYEQVILRALKLAKLKKLWKVANSSTFRLVAHPRFKMGSSMFIYCDLLREKFCNSIPVYCTRLFQMETEDRDICDPDTVFSNLNITWYAKSRITKSIPGLYTNNRINN